MFRNGQWVKFDFLPIPGAHRANDGRMVGIYNRASIDTLNHSRKTPEHIVIVNGLGENLMKGSAVWRLLPSEVQNLTAISSREDVPAMRLVGNPDWEPRP